MLASADDRVSELWHRLNEFEIGDPGVAFGFVRRLARDNGWTEGFARQAVDEYKRFLLLGQVAGHPVTPSDEVDQVWHLHLTYTRSYWDDLCGQVLGRAFHHGPTVGGPAEAAKFDDWYARTLSSYEEWFGSPPPARWWPVAEHRFGDAPHYVRLNTRRLWLVPKPELSGGPSKAGGLVGAGLLLAGCSGGAIGFLAQTDAGDIPGLFVIGLIVVVVLGVIAVATRGGGSGGRRGGGCSGGGSCSGGWSDGGSDGGSGCGGGGCGGGGCGGCGG